MIKTIPNHTYYLRLEPSTQAQLATIILLLRNGRERTVPELAQRMKLRPSAVYQAMQAALHLKLVRPARYVSLARTQAMMATMKKHIQLMGTGKSLPGRRPKPMAYRLASA